MKAKELRIGNLVLKNGIVHFVYLVSNTIIHSSEIGTSNIEISLLYEVEPIPLTEEWLLKAGFKNSTVNNKLFIAYGFALYIDDDNDVGVMKFGIDVYLCHIKYIHQLQNLYFALTGEELTIKA